MVGNDARVQFALGDVLEILVDRQLEARAGGRHVRRPLEAAEGMTPGVRVNLDFAVLAADLFLVGELDAREAVVVETNVPE